MKDNTKLSDESNAKDIKKGVRRFMSKEIYHNIVKKMIYIMHQHRYIMEKRLESTGVFQSQHRMLMHLSHNECASQKDIAEAMHISTATVAVTLKKLEKGGYIKKEMDTSDNRNNHIRITPMGQKVVEESEIIFETMDKGIFEGFTKEELKQYMEFLDRIVGNLKKISS